MLRPQKTRDSSVGSEARHAFSAAFGAALKHHDTNANAVAAAMKKRAKGTRKTPSQKTLSNMLNGSHPHQISNMEAVAEYFDIPLWMMLVPGMKPKLLLPPLRDRISKLMADYVRCNSEGRTATENMAAGHAALRKAHASDDED